MNFSIGCDPELFLKQDGKFLSVHNLLPGTKEDPFRVPGGAVQVDGVAAEFNIDPVTTQDDFINRIEGVINHMHDIIAGEVGPDFELVAEPVAYFEQDYFDALPAATKLLGCAPDFNAYTGEQNDPPAISEPLRTAGGHIHIGWDDYLDPEDPKHFALCRDVTRQLDVALYTLSNMWDKDTKRRLLCGQKGLFRPRTYGVEYRPLSNAWLRSERIARLVYDITMKSVTKLFNGERFFVQGW